MKKFLLLPLIAISVFTVSKAFFRSGTEAAYVMTEELTTTTVLNYVNCSGKIEAIRSRTLGVAGCAVVDKIYISTGDTVKQGQLLMTYSAAQDFSIDANLLDEYELLNSDAIVAVDSMLSGGYMQGYIEAPFSGVVTDIGIEEGEQLSPFIGAVQVCDLSRMLAVLHVNESELTSISVGMPVEITGDTFTGTRQGVVTEVSPVVTTKMSLTGSSEKYGEITVEILDLDGLLPGASVNAKISTSRISGAILVPYSAIGQDENGSEYVNVLSNGFAVKRVITTGEDLGDRVRVTSGLHEGETVITESPETLKTGTPVRKYEDN